VVKLIRKATLEDVPQLVSLAIQMWKSHTVEDLTKIFCEHIRKGKNIIFLAISEEHIVGFAQCGLRFDYVEGTDSSPVGYLEGIFVLEEYKKRGYAKELLGECQNWAKDQGCLEFASDCELDNEDSLKFHLKMGFAEANRIICFTKSLTDLEGEYEMAKNYKYKKATIADIDELVRTRIIVLRAANKLSNDVDMSLVEKESYEYYKSALETGEHVAYLVYDNETFIGTGGVSFYQVMPTYHNPTGKKAYIMNMYTASEYRRQGIAFHTLDLLVKDVRKQGVSQITLEATEMGRPLYEKYGFVKMEDEMELIK
jgi:aminoglycoside 6'-N-acetyltransferase I